jgi:hypothetical protein
VSNSLLQLKNNFTDVEFSSQASIVDCPTHFSLEEYRAFGVTPLGRDIFYQNILAQLAMPMLDFAKVEVQALLLQTVHQAGPSNGRVEREAHHIVAEKAVGSAMLEQLEKRLRSVAQNWESWRAAATFTILAQRFLGFTIHPEISERCLKLLAELRRVCMSWIRRIKERVASTINSEQRTDLYTRLIEVALLCSSTFDVEEAFIDIVLRQPGAISTLLQCSMITRENHESTKSEFENMHNSSLKNWRTLSTRIFPHVHQHVLLDSESLDQALSGSWTAFRSSDGTRWTSVDQAHKNWLLTTSNSLPVHFNLLTG